MAGEGGDRARKEQFGYFYLGRWVVDPGLFETFGDINWQECLENELIEVLGAVVDPLVKSGYWK